jgi:preprotein translocase subunit SecD
VAAPGTPRPGRPLALVALALIGLYLGLFLGPAQTPALGLDLRGGTQVTLTAQPLRAGGKVSKTALNQAVNIIRQRVNGLGVNSADVNTQGNTNIVVSVPGKGHDQVVNTVGQTALLRFRQVLEEGTASPSATTTVTPTPSESGSPSGSSSSSSPKTGSKSSSPKSSSSATSKATSSHGDAVRSALLADPSSSASPLASQTTSPQTTAPQPSSSATPAPSPSTSSAPASGSGLTTGGDSSAALPNSQAPSLTSALASAFQKLDCTKTAQQNPTAGADLPNDYIIACGTGQGAGVKYLLGPARVLGTQVSSASASLQANSVTQWEVNLSFNGSGSSAWLDLTRDAYNADPGGTELNTPGACVPPTGCNAVAIVLDGQVPSAPTITQSGGIAGGQAQITGSFTQTQATDLANILKYGSLPLKFSTQDVSSVSATLGSAQLRGGLIAGVIGLGLVVIFSLLYYRALGLVTVGSLAVSGLLLYAVTTLLGHSSLGYTLSLPGIAGFIVAVGITADSFVVFFERLRDEVREGRRLRSAVERAWPRARRTIISADFVSLLAAVVLYAFSIGDVRGFAFTLGLSTVSDLFIVFFFTRPLLTALARVKAFDQARPWTGVGRARRGVAMESDVSRRRRRAREV